MVKQVELIRRCQQGDREAMGQLYTSMHDELLAVCRRYVADGSVAEDLLHDAFLLIFSKIGELRSTKTARGWMHKVVKNVALLYVEKEHQLSTVPIDQIGDTLAGDTSERSIATETICYDELMHIVEALPEGYRRVFRLSVLEGLSHQQIAALLNIEPHSSSSQLYRAKTLLRQSLGVLLLSLLVLLLPLGIYWAVSRKGITTDEGITTDDMIVGEASKPHDVVVGEAIPADAPARSLSKPCNADSVGEAIPADAPTRSLSKLCDTVPDSPGQSLDPSPTKSVFVDIAHYSSNNWQLAMAYSGLPSHNDQSLPVGIEGTNGPIDSTAHHRLPLTIALDVSRQLNSRWTINGGLRYTLLSSEFQVGNTLLHNDRHQQVRYLGLSLGATYQLWPAGENRHYCHAGKRDLLRFYSTASLTCELPLRSTTEVTYVKNDIVTGTEHLRLHPDVQWSLGTGLGLQYNVTPTVGFFVEPNLRYYIPTDDGIETWRAQHPFTFSLPLGLRITF